MGTRRVFLNRIVAALLPIFLGPALAAQEREPAPAPAPAPAAKTLDELFADLKVVDERQARRVEREIWNIWSKSGSPAADLLLQRGRNALDDGETAKAIEHLTALVDHAPDFAEGWNARATAYFHAGLFGPSAADIAEALRREPRHFAAMAGFGAILEGTGQPEKALELYRAALAIHPHLSEVSEAIARLETQLSGQDL